ncbi:zinc ribbon domain-containing protein [Natrialbaceae archaeon A-CW3]
MTLVRALVAASLSLVFPGIGHAVLRDWIRALFFAGLFVTAVAISFSTTQLSAMTSFDATWTILTDETSSVDRFLLAFLALFTATDALFRGLGAVGGSGDHDGPTCPHCNRPLDEELEFCHWCTARLEPPAEDESVSP